MAYLHESSQGFIMISAISKYPTIRMSSAIPKTFGRPLNISSIFHLNISPAGANPKHSLENLYLPNWHANVITYKDFYWVLGCCNLSLYQ